ncbi:MAG: hypothetical protein FWD72_01755 [Eggerthellaceae bacterium]|nr:hypothetical protein [Eggerthellaceae bacterium]
MATGGIKYWFEALGIKFRPSQDRQKWAPIALKAERLRRSRKGGRKS